MFYRVYQLRCYCSLCSIPIAVKLNKIPVGTVCGSHKVQGKSSSHVHYNYWKRWFFHCKAWLLAGNPKSIPNKSKLLFFLANQRKIPIFGWFQYVSTKKITIFGAINHHRNPQLVTEVQRSLHGAMEATQRGQHPGEGQSLKPSPRATWRCHEKNHEEMVVSGWMMGEWWFNVGLMDVEWIWTRDFN